VWTATFGCFWRRSFGGRARREGRPRRRPEFSDGLIVLMFFWAVWHDRPMCWACDRCTMAACSGRVVCHSISRFSRRLRSPRVQRIPPAGA